MEEYPLNLLSFALSSPDDIHNYVQIKNGLFALTDSMTCDEPRRLDKCQTDCNRQILRIQAQNDVAVIRFDDWQKLAENEKCDFILFDAGLDRKRFSMCELTCSLEKYVVPDSTAARQGKRAKAFSQISNAWRVLKESHNPVFYNFALQFIEKIGIFGWRDRGEIHNTSKGGMSAMLSFSRTPGSASGISKFTEYTVDGVLTFIQVKYPTIFNW